MDGFQKKIFVVICTGKSLSEALLFAEHGENRLCTKIVLNNIRTISVHTMFSLGLSFEFSCIELVIQWTIVDILWVSWCKNKSFWQRFTCTYFPYLEKNVTIDHNYRSSGFFLLIVPTRRGKLTGKNSRWSLSPTDHDTK